MPTIIAGRVYLLGLGHSSSVLQVSLIFHPFLFAILWELCVLNSFLHHYGPNFQCLFFLSFYNIQDLKEIDELRMKLQRICQAHESAQTELQSLKLEHKNLTQEKV